MKKTTIRRTAVDLINGLIVVFLTALFPAISVAAQAVPVQKQFMPLRQKRAYTLSSTI